jgi:hypothetical protein
MACLLTELNPFRINVEPSYLKYILFLSCHLLLGLAGCPLPLDLTTKVLCVCISVPMRDSCLTHKISFDFLAHVTNLPMSMQGVTVPATEERKRGGESS